MATAIPREAPRRKYEHLDTDELERLALQAVPDLAAGNDVTVLSLIAISRRLRDIAEILNRRQGL